MKAIIFLLFLSMSATCYAWQNPVEYMGDKFQKSINDATDNTINKVKAETEQAKKQIKTTAKDVLVFFVKVFVLTVTYWSLSLTVGKHTSKMIKLIAIVSAVQMIVEFLYGWLS